MESPWSRPETVRGFAQSPPNETLLRVAKDLLGAGRGRALDIGCGAARNAAPLAEEGWRVVGLDTSMPMLIAARERVSPQQHSVQLVQAAMDHLPFADAQFDLVIAHGVWNLATSDAMFRQSVREAARVMQVGGALFVFTFSRNTLAADSSPIDRERYTYDQFSGRPQIFLTADELVAELASAGFGPDPAVPLTEHNRRDRALLAGGPPVIYEGAFRRVR